MFSLAVSVSEVITLLSVRDTACIGSPTVVTKFHHEATEFIISGGGAGLGGLRFRTRNVLAVEVVDGEDTTFPVRTTIRGQRDGGVGVLSQN